MFKIEIKERSKEAFYLEGNQKIGCLLIHGFTGTPGEMEPLGKYLNKQGYTVYAPLLSGHGTTPEELAKTSCEEILESAREGLDKLKHCQKVFILGLSMGGLISGILSVEAEIDGLVLMGTPVYLGDRRAYLAPLLKHFKPYVKKNEESDYPVSPTTYDKMPSAGIAELLKLRHRFMLLLDNITVPTLVAQGMKDGTVRKESGQYIYKKLGAHNKHLLELEKSRHIITLDLERELLFKEVDTFINQVCGIKPLERN